MSDAGVKLPPLVVGLYSNDASYQETSLLCILNSYPLLRNYNLEKQKKI